MKQRAQNNRTLTLTDAEASALRPELLTPDAIANEPHAWLDRIIWGDMLQTLQLLPDQMADLIIVDPPYNLTKQFASSTFAHQNDQQYEAYLRSWMHALCLKLKPAGTLYLCGDWRCTSSMQRVLSEELTILNRITWQREKGRGAARNWKNAMEDIWFAVNDPDHYYFDLDAVMMKRQVLAPYRVDGQPKDWQQTTEGRYRLTHPSNFWDDLTVPFWSMPENTDHPTQKPEKLIAKLILASSREGDVVFDPFLGSGTTAVVARKLGRHFCGIEREEQYCLWAQKRLNQALTDSTIQGYHDGVFWERNSRPSRD